MKNTLTGLALAWTCLAAQVTQMAHAADTAQVRSLAASCAACHGTQGSAQTGMPSLAGQPREALQGKMAAYKSGALPATLMHQIAKGYTDEQIAQLAAWFSALKLQGQP
ncbi:MAG: c-type cytochrome [Rhodoferax sp.]|nr:c-type cytochrome [Rhodoferax sp.]